MPERLENIAIGAAFLAGGLGLAGFFVGCVGIAARFGFFPALLVASLLLVAYSRAALAVLDRAKVFES